MVQERQPRDSFQGARSNDPLQTIAVPSVRTNATASAASEEPDDCRSPARRAEPADDHERGDAEVAPSRRRSPQHPERCSKVAPPIRPSGWAAGS